MTAKPQALHPEPPTLDHADIRWRVGQISKKDPHKGSLLGYIDARTCMEALDALDPNWSAVHGDPIIIGDELMGVPCALTVNGVTRSDVGMPSSQEPIKGAYSDALKRAAVHHGIGRELYELPRIYVKLDEYKKPVAIPTYRDGRWTLPSGAGSVFYEREPIEQPEQRRGARASSPNAAAPVQYRRGELAALMKEHNLDLAAVEAIADQLNITERPMSDESMDRLIEAIAQPGESAPSPADPPEAGSSVPASGSTPDPDRSGMAADPATESAAAVSVPPGDTPPVSAPTDAELLAAAGEGAEILPPKPGTPEYRALPNGTERANAKAYWDKHKDDAPAQESLVAALGGPDNG